MQVAIIARSSREMSLTVRIVWHYILSRVRVSVRPSIFFICEKQSKPRGNRDASASVYFIGHWPAIVTSGAGRHGWLAQTHRIPIRRRRCVGGGARVRAGACARVCVRACMRACVCACVRDVFAIYDNNILPRLIMIIIKNIILYFIQIRHTDDFPSTGTRLVKYNEGATSMHLIRCLFTYLPDCVLPPLSTKCHGKWRRTWLRSRMHVWPSSPALPPRYLVPVCNLTTKVTWFFV